MCVVFIDSANENNDKVKEIQRMDPVGFNAYLAKRNA